MRTAWNGRLISAFADAGRILGDSSFIDIATDAADFILRELRAPESATSRRTLRSWKDGKAQHSGTLEDYANLADGLLALGTEALAADALWPELGDRM